jgi:hypothetical protein
MISSWEDILAEHVTLTVGAKNLADLCSEVDDLVPILQEELVVFVIYC